MGEASVFTDPSDRVTATDLTPLGIARPQTAGKFASGAARRIMADRGAAGSNETVGQAPETTARTSALPPGPSCTQTVGAADFVGGASGSVCGAAGNSKAASEKMDMRFMR